jgi:8-oxo-dGTP pyrophosphatase MutT (NUDIX family)
MNAPRGSSGAASEGTHGQSGLSCGILIVNAGAELLLCHATGTARWDIPKGSPEAGETPAQAAVRETAEECGLVYTPADLLDLGRHAYRRGKDLHLHAVLVERFDAATACRCTSTFLDPRGRVRPEMDAFEWVAFERVPERCAKSMAALLAGTVRLDDVLRRLVQSRTPTDPPRSAAAPAPSAAPGSAPRSTPGPRSTR